MKNFIILSLFVLSLRSSVIAQEPSDDERYDYNRLYKSITEEYGFDQVLVNGIYYEDKYRNKSGHQFFPEDQLYTGDLVFRGKECHDVGMKYDIYDQQLIVFIQYHNSLMGIIPPIDFISAFRLGDKYFSKYNLQGEPRYYQVIFDSKKLKCLYYWSKHMLDTDDGDRFITYEFSGSKRINYLILNDSLMNYRNNRSFIEIFPKEIKSRIRHYIKDHHVKAAKSSDEVISELITYCNSLF
jgi:hypothetical protein